MLNVHFSLTVRRESQPLEGECASFFFSEVKGNYFNFLDHTGVFAIELFLTKALQNMTISENITETEIIPAGSDESR